MQFASAARVNSLFYISTLTASESSIVQDTTRFLRPFFNKISLPFNDYNINNKNELIDLLNSIQKASEAGLLPMIHIIGHGAKDGGLAISNSNEMLYWDELSEILQKINISCGNNLCFVASSCFGFEVIDGIKITQAAPFYMLIAPEQKLQFSYFIDSTKSLYEAIFSGMDIMEAYDKFASKQMKMFHCEKMFATVFAKYIIGNCRGEGRRLRLEHLVNLTMETKKFPDTPEMRSMLKSFADAQIGPTEEQFSRYSSIFFIGKPAGFGLKDILELVEPADTLSK